MRTPSPPNINATALPSKIYRRKFRCPPCKEKRAHCEREDGSKPCTRCKYLGLECFPAAPNPYVYTTGTKRSRAIARSNVSLRPQESSELVSPRPSDPIFSPTSANNRLSLSIQTQSFSLQLISLGFSTKGDTGHAIRTFLNISLNDFLIRCQNSNSDFKSPRMGKWGEELAWLFLVMGSRFSGNEAEILDVNQENKMTERARNKHHIFRNLLGQAMNVLDKSRVWTAIEGEDAKEAYGVLYLYLGMLSSENTMTNELRYRIHEAKVMKWRKRSDFEVIDDQFYHLLLADSQVCIAFKRPPLIKVQEILDYCKKTDTPPLTILQLSKIESQLSPYAANLHAHHQISWATGIGVHRAATYLAYTVFLPETSLRNAIVLFSNFLSLTLARERWRLKTYEMIQPNSPESEFDESSEVPIRMSKLGPEEKTLTILDIQETSINWFSLYSLLNEFGARRLWDFSEVSITEHQKFEHVLNVATLEVYEAIGRISHGLEAYAKTNSYQNNIQWIGTLLYLPNSLKFLERYLTEHIDEGGFTPMIDRFKNVFIIYRITKQISWTFTPFLDYVPELERLVRVYNLGAASRGLSQVSFRSTIPTSQDEAAASFSLRPRENDPSESWVIE